MFVVGTAGHVDHGKSSLVQALTGMNPDRLQEEQARQLTIDLGFAWLTLPNGESIGIVDVPGHEDFIENMLAGVGGIDVAVLVVAADEGVMPQTREHFDILQLLEIPQLLVAITKIDMVDDPDWLELVLLDVDELLTDTRYETVPVLQVSAHANLGLDDFLETLMVALQNINRHRLGNMPRLPIDRVFTLSGFGTVVTGTLLDDALQVGDLVEIQPSGKQGRIRGLQSHQQTVEIAEPGSRTAVNISGINHQDVKRGEVLTFPNYIHPTLLADVFLHYLPTAEHPLKHNAEVKVFCGTSEIIARVRLMSGEVILPSEAVYAQLQLREPLPAIRLQHFIIRRPSPAQTIGGGVILDTAPGQKWKRNRPDVWAHFERIHRGNPEDLMAEMLIRSRQALTIADIAQSLEIEAALLESVATHDEQFLCMMNYVLHREVFDPLAQRIIKKLEVFHLEQPLLWGIQENDLRQRVGIDETTLGMMLALLQSTHEVAQTQHYWHLSGFQPKISPEQQHSMDSILRAFQANPMKPPSVKEVVQLGGEDVLQVLLMRQELIQLNHEVLLAFEIYELWRDYAYDQLSQAQSLTIATFRDHFETTRKYALAFLEFLDKHQVTRLSADAHVLGRGQWQNLPKRYSDE